MQTCDMEQAFYADIMANVADDFPRLVFADWLEEHDQSERAQYIRLACQVAKKFVGVTYARLMNLQQPTPVVPEIVNAVVWQRGFVAGLRVNSPETSSEVTKLMEQYPLQGLTISGCHGSSMGMAQALLRHPAWHWITELELVCFPHTWGDTKALLRGKHKVYARLATNIDTYCQRVKEVAKLGVHGLARQGFSSSRNIERAHQAIEDAGMEVLDRYSWKPLS